MQQRVTQRRLSSGAIRRNICAVALLCVAALVAPSGAFSYGIGTPLTTDSRIKTFVFNENDVYRLLTHYGYQLNIEFGNKEEIETISVGDRTGWQIIPAGQRLFVRAMEDKAHTNMTVVTNRHAYQFDLYSSPPGEQGWDELVYVVRFYYPEEQDLLATRGYYGNSGFNSWGSSAGLAPSVALSFAPQPFGGGYAPMMPAPMPYSMPYQSPIGQSPMGQPPMQQPPMGGGAMGGGGYDYAPPMQRYGASPASFTMPMNNGSQAALDLTSKGGFSPVSINAALSGMMGGGYGGNPNTMMGYSPQDNFPPQQQGYAQQSAPYSSTMNTGGGYGNVSAAAPYNDGTYTPNAGGMAISPYQANFPQGGQQGQPQFQQQQQQVMPSQNQMMQPTMQNGYPPQSFNPPMGQMNNGQNFRYSFTGEQGILPTQMYDDGQRTFLTFNAGQMPPQIFVVGADRQEHYLPAQMNGSSLMLQGVYGQLILRVGGVYACIYNDMLTR
jgi:type IV secretion system protein VirB9